MKLKHLELIASQTKHPAHLQAQDGALLVGHGTSSAAGVFLERSKFMGPDLQKAIDLIIKGMGKPNGFKILGHPDLIQLISEGLNGLKQKIVNQVPVTGAFEFRFFPSQGRLQFAPKIKVLVVDDSKTIRVLLSKILGDAPSIEVVGVAEKPSEARDLIPKLKPDVITLDINMPEMDGVQFLQEYLPKYPIPTIMITAISMEEGPKVLQALESGAVDYIQKPSAQDILEMTPVLIEKVKVASTVKVNRDRRVGVVKQATFQGVIDQSKLIAIGSSTGGTEALRTVLTALPEEIPPIVITQHIPPVFSKAFADRMDQLCPFKVKEAEHNEEILPSHVYVAPGGKQMSVRKRADHRMFIVIDDSPPVNRHKPSVDYLFDSVAKEVGSHCIAVILTGMGADGAKGMLKLKNLGVHTIGQDEKSCVVYGMPREAFQIGAVTEQVSLNDIPSKLLKILSAKKVA